MPVMIPWATPTWGQNKACQDWGLNQALYQLWALSQRDWGVCADEGRGFIHYKNVFWALLRLFNVVTQSPSVHEEVKWQWCFWNPRGAGNNKTKNINIFHLQTIPTFLWIKIFLLYLFNGAFTIKICPLPPAAPCMWVHNSPDTVGSTSGQTAPQGKPTRTNF